MTVATLVSVKGAPGVTTLACLVGATWPDGRRVAVVEADPFGGDLAARFRLSTLRGWSSFMTAARRSEGMVSLGDHLQTLPGGLDVLVQPGADRQAVHRDAVEDLLRGLGASEGSGSPEGDRRDLVVDAGRLLLGCAANDLRADVGLWLDRSDVVVVVVRRDPSSLLKVRERLPPLMDRCADRMCLVVVGPGSHGGAAIEGFTGLPVAGEVPFDPSAARVITGEGGSRRRLSRSMLVMSSRRLAMALAERSAEPGGVHGARRPTGNPTVAISDAASSGAKAGLAGFLDRVLPRGARQPTVCPSDANPVPCDVVDEGDHGSPRRPVAR